MKLSSTLEAVLFASGEPMTKKKLCALLGASAENLAEAVEELRAALADRGLALVETGDELELRTAPEAADTVKKLREGELSKDLGKAGLEALAIIMYRLPAQAGGVTRSEDDWIPGVNSAQTVRSLMLRGLIERTEDPTDKRRFHYKPTTDALAHLGVAKLSDLPRYAELSKEAESAGAAADAPV
jgi:segregation and condensation protein B